MEQENDFHMVKYIRKHPRRDPPHRHAGGRSLAPNPNQGKGKGGQVRLMQASPRGVKDVPKFFYSRPTDDKGGPRHAPDCDGCPTCLLQLQGKQKTKEGRDVKHQDHFRCTIIVASVATMRANAILNAVRVKNTRKRKRNAGDGGGGGGHNSPGTGGGG